MDSFAVGEFWDFWVVNANKTVRAAIFVIHAMSTN
ncbi:hypothetical protein HCH_03346 [Hahella chejuensis KCTC 2396]|uniref:Uncharacterized protein n=1 Tax=Hahella chejuensis (strain KCTC 2396) TaxID=349521 RepID=Q2SGX4_HAHCH|nr:hypothetical protein HCH_03346 [Hahella chejuensis KCTC 2396]